MRRNEDMQARQRTGCSPHPSSPCSPAQTRFQVPSVLESTLQAIQDPSTCHSSCAILLPLLVHSYVACRPAHLARTCRFALTTLCRPPAALPHDHSPNGRCRWLSCSRTTLPSSAGRSPARTRQG